MSITTRWGQRRLRLQFAEKVLGWRRSSVGVVQLLDVVRLPMKLLSQIATLACLIPTFTGCATNSDLSSVGGIPEPGGKERLGYPVSIQSSVVMMADFKWWPELSGYFLPAGIYRAESEDTNGVFFKAPDGFKLESMTGGTDTKGGIYLPKQGAVGVRGHVYLWMSVFGGHWEQYLLPDQFFSRYGKTWRIAQSNEQPNSPLQPTSTAP